METIGHYRDFEIGKIGLGGGDLGLGLDPGQDQMLDRGKDMMDIREKEIIAGGIEQKQFIGNILRA